MTAAAPARPTTRRWVIIFGCALIFAGAVCLWQGLLYWRAANPPVNRTVQVGQRVVVEGSSYQVDSITAADAFPSAEQDQPPVRAPNGTKIVLVVLTTEIIDAGVDPDTHYCPAELVDDAGRSWGTESTITFGMERPPVVDCSGTGGRTITPGNPLRVGFSYVVPAEVADEVAVEIRLPPKDDYRLRIEQ